MRWGLPFLLAALAACSAEADFGQPVEDTCYFELEYSDRVLFYVFDLVNDLEAEVATGWVRSTPLLYGQAIYFAGSCNFTPEVLESGRGDLGLVEISEPEFQEVATALSMPVVVAPMRQGNER